MAKLWPLVLEAVGNLRLLSSSMEEGPGMVVSARRGCRSTRDAGVSVCRSPLRGHTTTQPPPSRRRIMCFQRITRLGNARAAVVVPSRYALIAFSRARARETQAAPVIAVDSIG